MGRRRSFHQASESSCPSRTRLAASNLLRKVRIYFGSGVGVSPLAWAVESSFVAADPAEAAAARVSSCSSVQTLPRLSNTCSNNLVSSVLRLEDGLVDTDLEEEREDMNASTGVVGVETLRTDLLLPVGVKSPLSRFRDLLVVVR